MNLTKFLLLILLAVFITGCEQTAPKVKWEYKEGKQEEASEFVLDCIKNANPLSDEEPEDWIWKCEKFAMKLYGQEVKGFRVYNKASSNTIIDFAPCIDAQTDVEKRVCR